MKENDTYKQTKVFQYQNAVVRVHVPDITEEERERRMKEIHIAAGRLLTSKNGTV